LGLPAEVPLLLSAGGWFYAHEGCAGSRSSIQSSTAGAI